MNSTVKYSLLASVLMISCKLGVYFTHSQFTTFGVYSGLIALLLILIPLVLAIRNRKDELKGFITMREVMKTALGISVVTALIVSIFTYLYFMFLDHETLEQLIVQTTEFLKKENKPQAEIDLAIISLKEFYTPLRQATGVLTGVLIAGLILSFISSTFFVKNPPKEIN